MISVIICSRDDGRFAQVQASIARAMGEEYEVVRVTDARSMCEGYTRGLAHSKGDVTIFCHDDIEFLLPNLGAKVRGHLERCDLVGVAGTTRLIGGGWAMAGVPYLQGQVAHVNPQGGYSLCIYGTGGRLVLGAQAVDGVFFACRREVVEAVGFDAATFDAFHAYDVDFSFRAHLAGYRVAVACDIPIIHASGGQFDAHWQKYVDAFGRKHQGKLAAMQMRPYQFAGVNVASKEEVVELMNVPWGVERG